VCGLGFGVSLLAIAQAATAGREIYWNFKTEFEGPLPFGPFVNRNHFATWMIMAVPLTFGYIAARANRRGPRDGPRHTRAKLVDLIDPRMAWLMVAAGTMLVALLLSLSRSGAVACGVSGVLTVALARHRLDARQRRWLLTAAAVVALLALGWADMPALQQRFAGTRTGVADRMVIWRDTMPVLGDFWLTGTGAGTYPSAMLVYQKADRAVYFNQAHNHYLQVAVEGGLLMVVALAVALGAFVRTASKRLRHDEAGLHWIRIGAAAGLGAAALQSAWETGLVMPANAALAAVLAALLVHERSLQPESASR
jgi:O-antigen ligase